MASSKTVDFYARKPQTLPRFVYRRLAKTLRAGTADRAEAIDAAAAELTGGHDPDLRKFKFTLPDVLKRLLSAEERQAFEAKIRQARERAARLKMVFPHVSDEFSLDREFLTAVLDMDGGPSLAQPGRFFTVGSCFARNIAEFLVRNGRPAKTFALAEDLNSPISNAFIFDVLRREPQDRMDVLTGWTRRIFPEFDEAQAQQAAQLKLGSVEQLAANLREAECVVLTLGNVVDFFREDAAAGEPLMAKIVPKFMAMPGSEDIAVRSNTAARLKKQGAALRLASYEETKQAIAGCLDGVRSVTDAPIVVTLSPVPVDSVIGLASDLKSAIEVDCVSKSRLRSAYDEVAIEHRARGGVVHYFPSFEIVRWIAPMLAIPNFGFDDAASRHVSSPILDAICSLFLERFVRWPDEAGADRPATATAAS